MPRLSIVIPCIQEVGCFEATLASVLQNRPDDCEVLVVQPRHYDDPYELKEEVRFVQAPAESTLVDLVNIGFERAEGEIVHLLSCDVEVPEGWTQSATKHFLDPTVGSVAPLIIVRGDSSQIVARGVQYESGGIRRVCRVRSVRQRARLRILAPTLSAGLYRRQSWADVGGFCTEAGAEFTDVDFGLMLHATGLRCVHEEGSVVTTASRHCTRLSMATGQAAECLFWRNAKPSEWASTFVTHPLAWLGEFARNLHRPRLLLHVAGRVRGWLERSTYQRHRHHLQKLQSRLNAVQSSDPVSKRDAALNTRAAA